MQRISEYKYHLAALFAVTVWGATFVSTKVLIANSLTPAEIFFLRFAMAYICIWPLSARQKGAGAAETDPQKGANATQRPQRTKKQRQNLLWAGNIRDELALAAAGITGGSFYFLAENMALEYAPASNVSLLVCTAPVWTAVLLSLLYRNERMSRRQISGSVFAFAGMVLVVLNGHFVLRLSPRGDLLALAAALLWMFYSLIIKRIGGNYPAIFITRKIFFYGLLTILPVFLVQPPAFDFAVLVRPVVWGNLVFLGVVASMLCYVLWNAAMHRLGAVRTTNYIYLNPLVTIVTAALFIGEQITLAALAGAALILYGMWRAEKN